MPNPAVVREAERLQSELRTRLGHQKVGVRPYGQHLLIQMHAADQADTIARLTSLGRNRYGAAFRTHTGRWEPLPGTGSRTDMAELVADLLSPYLTPENY
jgi:hypothetical protein